MKNFYNTRLLLLLCLVLSFGIITSCDDDDDVDPNGGQVQLLSFGPTGVQHGQEIRFIGRNLNQVEAIEFEGATVTKADFIEQTSALIRLVVPEETMAGLVRMKLSKGEDIVSKTVLSFEVPITVASVTPEAKPGSNITITGTKLNWVEGVMFEGVADTVDTFESQTATELVLQVPMTAKTGPLLLLGGGTEPTFVETEELIVTLPEATALAPSTIKTGRDLTITGTNLDLVKSVLFTGVGEAKVSEFVSQSATELVVTVPANAKTGALKLVALSGVEVLTGQELEVVLPAVTALSPSAIKHGENLTITGTNLDFVKEIKFKGVGEAKMSEFVSKSANRIEVRVPNNASTGTLTLVANSGVEVKTEQELAIILPAIASLSPSVVDPGQNLTINGTNLDLVKSIEFKGGVTVTNFVSQSANRIVVQVPMTAKKGVLKLTTVKDYVVATDAYVNMVLPAITAVTPEPVIPGNYLTISGTELSQVASVVFEGGATVSRFVAQNDEQIVLTVPADARTGNLKLITKSGFTITTDKQAQIGTAGPNITTYIYRDALNTGWAKWNGWGAPTQDLTNTENPNRGETAIKVVYDNAYGALQLHPNNANVLEGYSTVVLYVRGGSVDSRVALQLKNANNENLPDVPFNVKAGEYKLIEIPISSLGNVSPGIVEFNIKNYGTNPNTIYIDDIGLR